MNNIAPSESEGVFPGDHLQIILDNIFDLIYQVDRDGIYQYLSPSHKSALGYQPEELLGRSVFEFLHPDDLNRAFEAFNTAIRNKTPVKVEYRYRHKNGHYVWLESIGNLLFNDCGAIRGAVICTRDITEHKRAKEALLKSMEMFSKAFHLSPATMSISSIKTGQFIEVNNAFEERMGYCRGEVIGHTALELGLWANPAELARANKKVISEGNYRDLETEICTKSGNLRTGLLSAESIEFAGERCILTAAEDITDRKQAEGALKESEQRFRTSVETMLDGFAIFSAVRNDAGKIVDFKYEYINEAGCRLNLRSREEQIGHTMLELLPAHLETGLFNEYVEVVETGKPLIIEDQHYEDIYGGCRRLARSFDFQAFKLGDGFAATWRDTTERKRSEEELRDSKALLEGVLDGMGDIIAVQLPDHTIQRYNKAGYEFLGMKPEEVIGRRCYELMGWQKECDLCASRRALKSKRPEFLEKYIPELDTHLDCRSYPILDEKGEVKLIVEQLRDITAIKRSEDLLMRSEQEKSAVLNGLKDVIVEYVDPELHLIWANKAMQEYFGRPYDQLKGLHCYEMFQGFSEPCPWCLAIKVIQTGQFQEEEVTTPDGNTWVVRSNPLKDKHGQISGIVNIVLNITQRKQAEETLKASLQEKDVLLKEIHHRVKNNLQIIHSLLSIQANNIQDKSAREAIAECKNRVKSMALIHESLYRSENLAKVDFTRYVMGLTGSLFNSFGVDRRQIQLNLDLDPVLLSIDKAIPSGLVVNELVSNCLKHAFPGERTGEIRVELTSLDNDRILLIVRDDGIGLMESLEPHKAKTLGLRLVTDLVKQLKGEVQIDNRGGTEFKVVFPAGK